MYAFSYIELYCIFKLTYNGGFLMMLTNILLRAKAIFMILQIELKNPIWFILLILELGPIWSKTLHCTCITLFCIYHSTSSNMECRLKKKKTIWLHLKSKALIYAVTLGNAATVCTSAFFGRACIISTMWAV